MSVWRRCRFGWNATASNAQKVAEFLEANEKVAWVNYPGLKSSKYYELAQKYMPNGTCGVIFGLKGGRKAAEEMMDKLKLAAIVTHVADSAPAFCILPAIRIVR